MRRLDAAFNSCRYFVFSRFRLFSLLLASTLIVCLLSGAFAQDEEEEGSNAKPDAGGVVIEPSSGKIAEGDTITVDATPDGELLLH